MARHSSQGSKSSKLMGFSGPFLSRALGKKVILKSPCKRIWTDSRTLQSGDLFVAISGEKFDGHDFLLSAASRGATGAIVSQSTIAKRGLDLQKLPKEFKLIKVTDTTQALRKIAKAHRERLKISVIAVAGSNGKTTTKEWIAFFLREIFGGQSIFKTEKSNNSILGIALSLLQIRDQKIAVIEIGIDEPGWMDQHLQVVQPTHGIITTIAEEHLNRLKNIETVAKEELKLLNYLKRTDGAFAANLDSDWIKKSKLPKTHLTYALQNSADIEGQYTAPQILNVFGIEWKSPLPGRHNAQNILAALCVLRMVKPKIEISELRELSKKIERFEGEPHRSRLVHLKGGVQVFDDCYNANPDSMEKSLQAFSDLSSGCSQRVILGDMLDLGDASVQAHRSILNRALVLGFDKIYLFGERFAAAFDELQRPPGAKSFLDIQQLARDLKSDIKPNEFLFLKGSRGMQLERILEKIS